MKTRRKIQGSAGRAAAIVDLENIVIHMGLRLPCAHGSPYIDVVKRRVHAMPTRLAACKAVLREYMPVLATCGWGLFMVSTDPDAADIVLVEAGHDYIRRGVTDLVVVSGDHAFIELASSARLHVVAHASHLSRRLQLAATTVTYLPPIACYAGQHEGAV